MNNKKYFRIELYEGSNRACDKAVTIAALINGGGYPKLGFNIIKEYAERENCPDTTVELIGENILHIDRKIGEEYKTVCRIELVDVITLNDIPEELFVYPSNGFG